MQQQTGSRPRQAGGWRVRRSIAFELDAALAFISRNLATLPRSIIDLSVAIPSAWVEEFEAFGTTLASGGEPRYTFEYLARWAGVAEVEDYDIASTAMKVTTLESAISQVVDASGLKPPTGVEPIEQLIDLELRLFAQFVDQLGVFQSSDTAMLKRQRDEVLGAVQILSGGSLHNRFWRWMDRFYYDVYGPWRTTRLDSIAILEQTAIDGLGGREGTGPPGLSWLPDDNVLTLIPTARDGAAAGRFEVVFWAEPFGLSSQLVPAPNSLTISFARDGVDYDYSSAVSDDLTTKIKALADPTRLGILRMIRLFDADNTQVADYLGVSRPAVSVHAKILADAGFISTTRQGRRARHAFHPDAVRQALSDLLRYLDVAEEASHE
jgi:ArsR family transcriptional regulator